MALAACLFVARFMHLPEPGTMSYRTIVADPPWEYERVTGLGGKRAAADNYSTMSNAQIAALPIREQADSTGSHLYLWVTNPRGTTKDTSSLTAR